MDKNVSSVDLDELRKAREELNNEIGVETDPNMYSDYNPNREEEKTDNSVNESYESISLENAKDSVSSALEESSSKVESVDAEDNSMSDHHSSEDNLSKYDAFSAFEVKENVHNSDEKVLSDALKEDSSVRTTNLDKIEKELSEEIKNEKPVEDEPVSLQESQFETIDNVEELEKLLDNLLSELDDDIDISDAREKEPSEQRETLSSATPSIEVEPNFDEEIEENIEESAIEAVNKEDDEEEDYLAELVKDKGQTILDHFSNRTTDTASSVEESEVEEYSNVETDNEINEDINFENYQEETQVEDAQEEPKEKEVEEVDESSIVEAVEEENSTEDNEVSSADEQDEEEIQKFTAQRENKLDEIEKISRDYSQTIENYDATKAKPSNKPATFGNAFSDSETEIITDYSQLRDILQRELKESEQAAQERIEEEEEGEKYEVIEDFKFINEIATDEFKSSDKFSYIMGKDEKGEMIYGNFREHFNLAVFSKNETVTNSFLNSMVLSLCLKNSTSDINFVMLDSDINSAFEVYNKSSYLYFNRIAKTNKEILDTLIEITKELDERYEKFAETGMTNIEQYNDMAKETNTTPMPMLIVVFNNYTSASQATYIDKINACLYQILKFGRIVGIYVVVTAMLPIETAQVNYNLSSRLSFKSDQDSKYTVGVDGSHRLPDENDANYFNITKNTTTHIKTATVTDIELDLIIKELEE